MKGIDELLNTRPKHSHATVENMKLFPLRLGKSDAMLKVVQGKRTDTATLESWGVAG